MKSRCGPCPRFRGTRVLCSAIDRQHGFCETNPTSRVASRNCETKPIAEGFTLIPTPSQGCGLGGASPIVVERLSARYGFSAIEPALRGFGGPLTPNPGSYAAT